jgi:peptidoglycan/LPS O-acetylase OafA/YrhL
VKYRAEIDGLRTIAVIPVILFHAGISIFRGGYVGVDIFFVISGFLITSIIARELEENRFSIVKFYERRARRILPALFAVLLVSLPFAWALLMPDDLLDFGKSVVSVCLFVSNLYFWRSSGYFDAAAEGKPLLHTWSLAVEEQYYVLFPLMLMVLWRLGRKRTFYIVCAMALGSLVMSEWAWRHAPTANFFLAPTRAWELFAGSICALWRLDKAERPNGPLAWLGLALIAFSIFVYDEHTPFPSVYALVPVVGTALIILFATSATRVGQLLSTRPMVAIGLISYSAYLWHQPILAFARHYWMSSLSPMFGLLLAAISLAVAYPSWRYIEAPFRRPAATGFNRKQIFGFAAAGLAGFAAIGAWGIATNGAMFRFYDTPQRAEFARYFQNNAPAWDYMEREHMFAKLRYDCDFYDLEADRRGAVSTIPKAQIPSSCFVRDGRKAVFLWGDSHAMALRPGLTTAMPADWQILQVATSACPAEVVRTEDRSNYCKYANGFATRIIATEKPEVVIVAQNEGHSLEKIYALRQFLESAGVKRIIFAGPSPHWHYHLPNVVLRAAWENTPRYMALGLEQNVLALDGQLKRDFKPDGRSQYVSLIDIFCRSGTCMTYLGDDKMRGITTYDYGHLAAVASERAARTALVPAVTRP